MAEKGNQGESDPRDTRVEQDETDARRPYEPPRIRCGRAFEKVILASGPEPQPDLFTC